MKTKTKSPTEVRKATVNFSLSRDEKQKIAEAADSLGMTMSGYIRYKLFYESKA